MDTETIQTTDPREGKPPIIGTLTIVTEKDTSR
jgi:hypothetical protein